MKTIIAGSRTITDYAVLLNAINSIDWKITEVLSGAANGVDKLGERWAKENNVPVKRFYPNWNKYGNYAGLKRNEDMVNNAEALIALWDGESKGTIYTIKLAQKKKLKTKWSLVKNDKRSNND